MSELYIGDQEIATNNRNRIIVTGSPSQLAHDMAREAHLLHHTALRDTNNKPGRFALCWQKWKSGNAGEFNQRIFDLHDLPAVMQMQVVDFPDRDHHSFWISQATLGPWARDRRVSSIVSLNSLFADIDIEHAPDGFDRSKLPKHLDYDRLAHLLTLNLVDAGLPVPSDIFATGGGLCAKWRFDAPLPSRARARWQTAEKFLLNKISEISENGTAWPVDFASSDPARIFRLEHTVNPKRVKNGDPMSAVCRLVGGNNQEYSFDYLCEILLPFTKQQLEARRAETAQWKNWDANRAAAAAEGIRQTRHLMLQIGGQPPQTQLQQMDEMLGRELHVRRFEFCRALFHHRAKGGGGTSVPEGMRNRCFAIAGNSLAYSCLTTDTLLAELKALHKSHFSTLPAKEVESSIKYIIRRRNEGVWAGPESKKGLRAFKTETFLDSEHLNVSPEERRLFGHLLASDLGTKNEKREEWDHGVMKFPKMTGLSFNDYIKETRRRQTLAGARTAALAAVAGGRASGVVRLAASAEKRVKAMEMVAQGMTMREIAAELDVGKSTVSDWLKSVR